MGPQHNCGVVAVSLKENGDAANRALFYLYRMLLNLQNRGQLSAGVTTFNPHRTQILDTYKQLGTINEAFRTSNPEKSMKIFTRYAGTRGIAHTRYATCGPDDKSYAQPFERHHGRRWKWFSFCFNGNISNFMELKKKLIADKDYHITLEGDTEIVMHYISRELAGNKKPNLVKVFRNLSRIFDGAYNIVFINAEGEMVIVRDPIGFWPLCYSIADGNLFVASESNALFNIGLEDIQSLEPGCMIHVKDNKIKVLRYAKSRRIAHCMFEYVYFSNVSSIINDRSVYLARTNMGKELAKEEKINIGNSSIVVPVPDTAKAAGDSMAYELGLPSIEGLIRNRYVGRTFIEGKGREEKVQNKFTALRDVLQGKKVILVDDSVVRGTTSKQIVNYVKEVGKAKEVHLRVSCPPVIAPCVYGIDMSTVKELLVPRLIKNFNPEKGLNQKQLAIISRHLGADSVRYQSIEGLVRAIGLPKNKLCTACISGKYPTAYGQKLYKKALLQAGKKISKRTYE